MDRELVNNKVFYSDFRKEIRREVKELTVEISKLAKDRQSIIKGLVSKIDMLKDNYRLNGSFTYSVETLTDYLMNESDILVKHLTVINKVSDFVNKYVTNRIKELAKINYDIKAKVNTVKDLKSCAIPYTEYRDVSNSYNDWCMRYCLDGGSFILAPKLGTISILNLKKDFGSNGSLKVDNKKSQAYKQLLIDKGEIPYNKQDHDEALAKGDEYKGVEWLIYYYDDSYPYVHWFKGSKANTGMYKFIPARGNNAFKSIDDAIDFFKVDNDPDKLFDKGMGFVQNLSVLRKSIPGYMHKFRKGFNG